MENITVFALRDEVDYVLAVDVQKEELSPASHTYYVYEAHWTGTEWEAYGGDEPRIFEQVRDAEEYLRNNRKLMLRFPGIVLRV